MRVIVKLFATLRDKRFDVETRDYGPGTTVADIIKELGIPQKEVTLIFINGRHAGYQADIADGDTVALFPPVGGG